jgi:hypothetical protein
MTKLRLRYLLDDCLDLSDHIIEYRCHGTTGMKVDAITIMFNEFENHIIERYHGTSIMYDAITILWNRNTAITGSTHDINPSSPSLPPQYDVYVTASTLFHRFYYCNGMIGSRNNNDIDVWSVSMASILLACKLHDLPSSQISISDIIYTFIHIYTQRILLPNFIPGMEETTVDVMAKQEKYYTTMIAPFVPNEWRQRSTEDRQNIFKAHHHHTWSNMKRTISPHGPIYEAWHQAIVQMECQILRTLGYRIYDVVNDVDLSSIDSNISTFCQRFMDDIRPVLLRSSSTGGTSTACGSRETEQHRPHSLSNLIKTTLEYRRVALQIIVDYNYNSNNDNHTNDADNNNDSGGRMDHRQNITTTTTITIPQIIACACLYCAVTDLDIVVNSDDNTQSSGFDWWKSILLLEPYTPNQKVKGETSMLHNSIQNEIDTMVCMIYRTIRDPNYFVACSNYWGVSASTKRFHGPDSFTWDQCITNRCIQNDHEIAPSF